MRETIEIGIDQIRPNRNQPRVEFNNDAIYELAQSIRENGLIQPIVVRKVDNHYEIIAGERRYRAMQMLGYTTVTALVSTC
jgi:ParB family transcriptional regulator, chromosome partitioning protein